MSPWVQEDLQSSNHDLVPGRAGRDLDNKAHGYDDAPECNRQTTSHLVGDRSRNERTKESTDGKLTVSTVVPLRECMTYQGHNETRSHVAEVGGAVCVTLAESFEEIRHLPIAEVSLFEGRLGFLAQTYRNPEIWPVS